jgi:hypothetical protein
MDSASIGQCPVRRVGGNATNVELGFAVCQLHATAWEHGHAVRPGMCDMHPRAAVRLLQGLQLL